MVEAMPDPVRDKPRRSGRARIAQTAPPSSAIQCGVRFCTMDWRTMDIGAPPQLEAN